MATEHTTGSDKNPTTDESTARVTPAALAFDSVAMYDDEGQLKNWSAYEHAATVSAETIRRLAEDAR